MKNNNKGFTLVEIMATLALLAISSGVIGVNAVEIKKDLNQAKANATARQIFMSAQDNLSKMKASGSDIPEKQNSMDWPVDNYSGSHNLKYITSDNQNISSFCDTSFGGEWVIEYDSLFGNVFGVFWSAGNLDSYSKTEDDNTWRHASNDYLIDWAQDPSHKYNVAYYGGDTMDSTEYKKDPPKKVVKAKKGFCYYEIYEDDGNEETLDYGYYEAAPNYFSNLQKGRFVIGDGYGVVLDDDSQASHVAINGTNSLGSLSSCLENKIEMDNGIIVPLPASWMCAANDKEITNVYYSRISTYNIAYYWNIWITYDDIREDQILVYSPFYAKTMVDLEYDETKYANDKTAEYNRVINAYDHYTLPTTVYIRSARQLNAMSWLYSTYYNKFGAKGWKEPRVLSTTFEQELNIDYAKYEFNKYTGKNFVGQLPIGTDWGGFISTYNGKGNTIYNVKLLRMNKNSNNEFTFAGLFGFVYGNITDVHVDGTKGSDSTTVSNADYCGVIAAFIQNGNITNCSVNNYTINYDKPLYNDNTTNLDFCTRIGGLIGYIKCPATDTEPGGTVSGNTVSNCTITIKNYYQNSYSRSYKIGCFVGSVAERESNSRCSKVILYDNKVKDCVINTKGTSSYDINHYIGKFAGAVNKKATATIKDNEVSVTCTQTSYNSLYYAS